MAAALNLPFHDADDFHPAANQEKLSADIPLNDADREPWLEEIATHMRQWAVTTGAVLACSALKHSYRSQFRAAAAQVKFVFLEGDPNLIAQRVQHRSRIDDEHMVKDFVRILEGQFRDLEIPTSATRVDISKSPGEIVEEILDKLNLRTRQ